MDPDDIEELAMEFQGKTIGGWGLVQLAAGTGFAAYVMWAGVLMPGFCRVPLKLQEEAALKMMKGTCLNMQDLQIMNKQENEGEDD
ncbi:adenine nucleotide translocase lysine N-methyltransferase-like [Malaclemys terrapin pileata]|uniref:adenine nucleotide translocase lysine N-methyltransferase-like n=1 Tax=Malaclemys terrapin pileata TaxID=2991368 RepID=UPI0023A855E4|nr:adenine nucleotide translocase lysine N-methyltransferase-like [Malaclemys terrapin pileata]